MVTVEKSLNEKSGASLQRPSAAGVAEAVTVRYGGGVARADAVHAG